MTSLEKVFDPKKIEDKWYKFWMDKGYFHADESVDKIPFCIVIPPPNVTGALHIGHALNNTLQDILIRWKRMEKSGGEIIRQLKRLGASCDWQRERFTMDEGLSLAVREVFVRLYEDGLIYKGNRLINWCPRCHTALSDLEVEHEEQKGHLYYIKYPILDDTGNLTEDFILIATTRPETMLGDTAVAVNPDDDRYKRFIGKVVLLPIVSRKIPVIADKYVDMQFGTGALKITPAHDPNDFEIGIRHNLPQVKVIAEDGTMNENAGKYRGLDRYKCRKALTGDLEKEDR